jgi:hypothetical protein
MLETLVNSLLLLWAALPLMMWVLRLVGPRRVHVVILFVCTVVVGYFLYVGAAMTADVLIEQRMNRFDLDGDGGISGDELTPEAQQAIDDWASDTGRTFAFITALPVTAIWAAIWLTPLCAAEWIVRRHLRGRKSNVPTEQLIESPADDGNPYKPLSGS